MLSVMMGMVPRNLFLGKTLAMCVNCLLASSVCQHQVRKCQTFLRERANFIFNPWTQDCNRLWSRLKIHSGDAFQNEQSCSSQKSQKHYLSYLGPFNFSEFPNKLNLGISVTIVDITDLYPTFL